MVKASGARSHVSEPSLAAEQNWSIPVPLDLRPVNSQGLIRKPLKTNVFFSKSPSYSFRNNLLQNKQVIFCYCGVRVDTKVSIFLSNLFKLVERLVGF